MHAPVRLQAWWGQATLDAVSLESLWCPVSQLDRLRCFSTPVADGGWEPKPIGESAALGSFRRRGSVKSRGTKQSTGGWLAGWVGGWVGGWGLLHSAAGGWGLLLRAGCKMGLYSCTGRAWA